MNDVITDKESVNFLQTIGTLFKQYTRNSESDRMAADDTR